MSDIPTWHERAMRHPDHQSGMISEGMIRARMAEEIADLRAEVERLRAVLRQCACSCKALRESCPELEMDGTCPHLSAQESLEGKL
jgi:hypothetical protein